MPKSIDRTFLDAIINTVADPIFVKDRDHRWIVMNDAMCEFMRAPREKLIGLSDYDYFPKAQADEFWAKDDHVFETGGINVNEEAFTDADGIDHVIETKKSIFTDPYGNKVLVGVIRDITDLRKKNEALARAKADAETATMAKAEFLANMSHEIRTPLHGVIGMAELLLQYEATEGPQRECAEVIMSSSTALLGLLNDILDLSKVDAGQLTLESREFDVIEATEDAVDVFAATAQERGLELVTFAQPGRAITHVGDSARLKQVVTNLVGNAVKFTSSGYVVVRIETRGSLLTIAVEDSGIGIDRESRAALFRPFVQADTSTPRRFGGTGLGLSISARVAEIMGGRLGVVSEPGQGSTFTLEIPLCAPTRPHTEPKAWPSRRALVIESGARTREALTNELEARGFEVVRVSTTAEGLATWESADVALVDAALLTGLPRDRPIIALVPRGAAPVLGPEVVRLAKPVRRAALERALSMSLGETSRETPSTPSPESRSARPAMILVVEDNPTNQLVIERMLDSLGHRAVIASDGAEGLAMLATHKVDLVLMDCRMPIMDGYTATRQARARERAEGRDRIPIIALTASASADDERACRDAGMDGYLSKPILLGDLQAALEAAIL